jgi:hypothetical protein
VPACFVRQWLQLGYGKTAGPDDACALRMLETVFAEGGFDVRQLLLALTQTDSFLYREAP